MPQETKAFPYDPNSAPQAAHSHVSLEGLTPPLGNEAEIRDAVEQAFSYRGDITIKLKNGAILEGYIFDRRISDVLGDCQFRLIAKDSEQRHTVSYGDVARLAFTGRDTAAGKSFETWVKKYRQKKAAGEKNIRLEPEKIDEAAGAAFIVTATDPLTANDQSIHIDLDGAWDATQLLMRTLNFRDAGPRLRYIASSAAIEDFNRKLPRDLPPFILYGSGDFHHLSGLWLRRAAAKHSDVTLVSFDNHPDWDIRPPRWGCGGWINRALELPSVRQVHVWGCGNFELAMPAVLFSNRRALRSGKLQVHPWAERQAEAVRRRFDCMTQDNWKDRFRVFGTQLANRNIYITVDIDCLIGAQAVTNWESGLFTAEDVAWAITELRSNARVIGGDLCGAYSPLDCAGLFRRLAVWWDHPKLPSTDIVLARRINSMLIKTIWEVLASGP